MKWHRELKAIALAAGADAARVEHGGKHLRLIVSNGAHERIVTVASTPSDSRRTRHNIMRDVRHELAPAPASPPVVIADQLRARERVNVAGVIEAEPSAIASSMKAEPITLAPTLYHYTTSCQLPHIIMDGALVPLENEWAPAFEYYGREWLWATTSPVGCRSSGSGKVSYQTYRRGAMLRVRVAFPGDGWRPWREALEMNGQHVYARDVEKWAALHGENPDEWYVRGDRLSLDDCFGVAVRAYTSNRWHEITGTDLSEAAVIGFKVDAYNPVDDLDPGFYLGVTLGHRTYCARTIGSELRRSYQAASLETSELLRVAALR